MSSCRDTGAEEEEVARSTIPANPPSDMALKWRHDAATKLLLQDYKNLFLKLWASTKKLIINT